MSTAMMSAPSCASRIACDRPWPRAAPVMKATLPSSLPATFITSFTGETMVSLVGHAAARHRLRHGRFVMSLHRAHPLGGWPRVPGRAGPEAGQRVLLTGPVRAPAGRAGPDGHRHRTGPVRMITERPGDGGAGDRRERALAMPPDALRVGAVQPQPSEELGRHAPAT